MPTLPETRIAHLLTPYLAPENTPPNLLPQLSLYLDLLLRWNARTNLTAIRDPEEIVARHFGESLFAAQILAPNLAPNAKILDFGSGAGFPGLPLQLLYPDFRVTLAESQSKKSSFLREAVRTLSLPNTEIWPSRVDQMPPTRLFDAVTLRAVDNPTLALTESRTRLSPHGYLLSLHGDAPGPHSTLIPNSENRWVTLTVSP